MDWGERNLELLWMCDSLFWKRDVWDVYCVESDRLVESEELFSCLLVDTVYVWGSLYALFGVEPAGETTVAI